MAKKNKKGGFNIMDFAIVGGIAAVAYFLFSSFSKGPIRTDNVTNPVTPNPVIPPPPSGPVTQSTGSGLTEIYFNSEDRNKILKLGSRGDEVKALQLYLKIAGKNIGASGADGIFGGDTLNALKSFGNVEQTTLGTIGVNVINVSTGRVYGKSPFQMLNIAQEWTANGWV